MATTAHSTTRTHFFAIQASQTRNANVLFKKVLASDKSSSVITTNNCNGCLIN